MTTSSLPTESPGPSTAWFAAWFAIRANVAANDTAAAIAVGGAATEVAFAWQRSGHALWSGGWGSVLAWAFLLWFWLSVSWCAWCLARCFAGGGDAKRRWLRRLSTVAALFVAVFIFVAYAISWGMFLQTGRFANWEAVRFTLFNLGMLGEYMQAADAVQFLWLALLVAISLAGFPLLARKLQCNRQPATGRENLARWRLGLWLVLMLAVALAQSRVAADASLPRRISRIGRYHHGLNPAITLLSSAVEAWQRKPIEPCLDISELVRIDSTRQLDTRSSSESVPPSIILVAVEALRHDVVHLRHQGREVMPHVNRLANNGLQLTRAYAQSTHSDYADVCLASSLYPLRSPSHHFYRYDDPWPKTLLYDVLKPRGYATAIISSQNESWGGMDQFLDTPSLDYFYHPERSSAQTFVSERDPGFLREIRAGALFAGKFPDRHTVDVALDWIGEQPADHTFFLAMNFQSSHFPYLIPDDCPRPFQPARLDDDVKFSSYPKQKTPMVRNAYYNALAESDRQIGRLVHELKKQGRFDNTILVVTGENGEAFHENGAVGHACNPVEPVVHVAAVVHAPNLLGAQVEDYPFEHVDLAPTLLGLLGIAPHPNFQGMDVLSANRPPIENRLLFFHVLSPIAQADAVLLAGRWKFMVHGTSRQAVLYDLQSDPTESRDTTAEQPELAASLADVLARWRRRQLAYYHYPQYYGRFYPPRPPKINPNQDAVDWLISRGEALR